MRRHVYRAVFRSQIEEKSNEVYLVWKLKITLGAFSYMLLIFVYLIFRFNVSELQILTHMYPWSLPLCKLLGGVALEVF